MIKNRGFLIAVILLAALAILLLLGRDGTSFKLFRPKVAELPQYLADVVPDDWDPILGKQQECNFDDDGDLEWLVVYRYDNTLVQAPYRADGATIKRGPIGAAVFDRQTNVVPEGQGNESPYRPTMLIPYRLLPDFYSGKGLGYLSETGASDVEIIYHPPISTKGVCKVAEISILGYADSQLPTRLSIFRWESRATGFRAKHFVGNARIAAPIKTDGSQTIETVTTYNRLENHRSLLCESRTYRRTGEAAALNFDEDPSAYTIDFCYNAPPDPTYPEGVVVALLRNSKPTARQGTAPTPPTNGFLIAKADTSAVGSKAAEGIRILSVTHPASVSTDPAGGRPCTPDQVTATEQVWICGRESAVVETEIMLDGEIRRAVWQLISLVPDQIDADVHWRVQSVTLPEG